MTRWFNRPDGRLDLTRGATTAVPGPGRLRTARLDEARRRAAGRLARAAGSTVAADGAAISLVCGHFSGPIGSSDDIALLAEQLQFSRCEGPGLDAARQGRMFVVDDTELARRWPSFAAELAASCAFHGVIALPLALGSDTRGALDLYVRDAATLTSIGLADAVAAAEAVVAVLGEGVH